MHLIGRLATGVEVKEVNGGSKVSSFILAVDRCSDEADFALLHTKVRGGGGLSTSATLIRNTGGRPILNYAAWPIARAYIFMTSG